MHLLTIKTNKRNRYHDNRNNHQVSTNLYAALHAHERMQHSYRTVKT